MENGVSLGCQNDRCARLAHRKVGGVRRARAARVGVKADIWVAGSAVEDGGVEGCEPGTVLAVEAGVESSRVF